LLAGITKTKVKAKTETVRCRTDNKFPSLLPAHGVGVVIIIIVAAVGSVAAAFMHTTSS